MLEENQGEEKKGWNIDQFLKDPEKRKRITMLAMAGIVLLVVVAAVVFLGKPKYPSELFIDTVASPIATRVKLVKIDAPYYTRKIRHKTVSYYKRTSAKTKWLEFKKPNRNYEMFLKSIAEAAQYGLNPEHYDVEDINEKVEALYKNKKRTAEEISNLDIRITASFFLFTTHLIEGRIRQAGYGDFIWKKNIPKENDIELLANNSSGDLQEIIRELHPPHEQYEKLRKALIEYRKLEATRELATPVSARRDRIEPGEKNAQIPVLRKRLIMTDIKKYDPDDSLVYDEKMVEGVKQFQSRHGLEPDGILGETTLRFLNQSFREKADLIELNLERIRWLPREYGDDYISVNVPEYMLRVVENGKTKMTMRVVLGSEFNATPIFSDTLEYVVFSPTWNVPESIMMEEMIPDLQQNPLAYDPERFVFYRNGEEIHPEDIEWDDEDLKPEEYRIVERPGMENSLGLVKFIMPNSFNVYLHDTPAERLFKKNKRAFSHGCIRLERPVDLAKYLLRDNNKWDEEKMRESMKSEEPVTVYLKKKYHVEIEYRTVWVDENGLLHFREDVYDHDKRQLAMLNRIEGVSP